MKSRLLRVSLLLLGLAFCLPGLAQAQDVLTVTTNHNGVTCWDFSVRNNNAPSHLPINRVGLKLVTSGPQFSSSDAPSGSGWIGTLYGSNQDSVLYTTTGSSITTGQTLGGFSFCLDVSQYDVPVQIQWTTMSNNTVLTSGTFNLVPTTFQSLAMLDTATATFSGGSPDPCFAFSLTNRNSASASIQSVVLKLPTITTGTVRPSTIVTPTGWVLDSVTPYTVTWHSTLGSDITSGKTQSGFQFCMRANPAITSYNFVWNALGEGGALIDRDTIRNIAGHASSAPTSNDTVRPINESGCLYTFNISNFHALNNALPSPLTKVVFTSMTTGVTFQSISTTPKNWGSSLGSNNTSATFQAASSADALPSGLTNSVQMNLDNPSGGAFTIHWATFNGTTQITEGDLPLTCTPVQVGPDVASLANGASNCSYTLNVKNQHNPPSNLYAVSVQITSNNAQFQTTNGSIASTSNWDYSLGSGNTSIRFFPKSGTSAFMASNTDQTLNFSIDPSVPNAPVTIKWATYDQAGTEVSNGTVNASCARVTVTCDTVTMQPVDPTNCLYGFVLTNRRGTGKAVTSLSVAPTNGWLIDSVLAPTGWSKNVDANGSTALITSPTGVADGTQQGFMLGFTSTNAPADFKVVFTSTDADGNKCNDTLALNCQTHNGVEIGSATPLALSVVPNPTTSQSEITFQLPVYEHVAITVADIMGRTQKVLASSTMDAGSHSVTLDAQSLVPGTYYVRIETPTARLTRKIVVLGH